MTAREQLNEKILAAKRRLGLKWSTIAAALGTSSSIVYTAALLGQFPLTPEEAEKAVTLLELEPADAALLIASPNRGAGVTMPPTDPLIYRFYELLQNYGTTWKALIEEEFGDGIMSAIDFNMSIARQPDPKGDRVKIEMSGQISAVQALLIPSAVAPHQISITSH
jgi:cyanate lyase